MAGSALVLQPGEALMIVAADPNAPRPTHPIMLPGMPGWGSGGPPPVAGWPGGLPGGGGFPGQGGPVDPGYGIDVGGKPLPPGNWSPVYPSHPITNPSPPYVDAGPPVVPPVEPPPVQPPPADSGNWLWAWSPQLQRWVWVKVPGEGEAAPKT